MSPVSTVLLPVLMLFAADTRSFSWGYEACDQKAITYPYPDDPGDGFPPGSCPPPAAIDVKCPNDSKIKVVGADASSWEKKFLHPPKYAIDDHMSTRWSSEYTDDQWLILDLGAEKAWKRLHLVWELAHGTEYAVATSSDKKAWKTVFTEKKSDGFLDTVEASGKGRYLKIQGLKRAKVGQHPLYGYSLFDVTVCADAAVTGKK